MAALSLFLLLLLGAEPAQADAQAQQPKPVLVCREGERQLGSHMRTGRKCQTQEQWDAEDSDRSRRPVTLRVTGEQGDGQPRRPRPP